MKVAVYNLGEYFTPHLETMLELTHLHLDQGDEVIHYQCDAALPVCHFNTRHELSRCLDCISRRESAMRLLPKRIPNGSIIDRESLERCGEFGAETAADLKFNWTEIKQLQTYVINNFDIGYATASTIIDLLRDPTPDLGQHSKLLEDFIRTAWAVYVSTLGNLSRRPVDRVYVMNGRWAIQRAVFSACRRLGIDCVLHERGGALQNYNLFLNCFPHNIEYHHKKMMELWEKADPKSREIIGAKFFEDKIRGIETQWYSFTAQQTPSRLPDGWESSSRNVGVFPTSEFEFASIDLSWKNPFYEDQADGIIRLVRDAVRIDPRLVFTVRIHPNMRGAKYRGLANLLDLEGPNLRIIPADSKISSYALLKAVDRVLTFGSTMGIEAVYWGKPSILIGPSLYQNLEGVYRPDSHEEAVQCLVSDLETKSKSSAIIYGYYWSMNGIPFKYFKPETPFTGRFKGRTVDRAFGMIPESLMGVYRGYGRLLEKIIGPLSQRHYRRLIKRFQPPGNCGP